MNGNINVQVIGESSQSADLEQVLTNFKAKPYSKDAHIVISQDDLEVPAKYTSKDSILPETEYDPEDHYFDDTDEICVISEKRKENSFVTDVRAKKPRGN